MTHASHPHSSPTEEDKFLYRSFSPAYSESFSTSIDKSTSTVTDLQFDEAVDETLDSLCEFFENIGDSMPCHPDYDVYYSDGVLTVKLGGSRGTYVINKQGPNKQIWLSSPTSGPKRYDLVDKRWIYRHTKESLHDLLTTEITACFNESIDFSSCSYSSNEKGS